MVSCQIQTSVIKIPKIKAKYTFYLTAQLKRRVTLVAINNISNYLYVLYKINLLLQNITCFPTVLHFLKKQSTQNVRTPHINTHKHIFSIDC